MPKPPEKKTRAALAGAVSGDCKKVGRPFLKSKSTPKRAEKQSSGRADRVRFVRAKGRPELTRGRVLDLLEYDPETGLFRHKISRGGFRAGDIAGTISADGYRLLYIDYFQWRASRIAWLVMTGSFPPAGKLIDHRDGDRSRDVWENLRLATYAENARNRRTCARNKSGRVGVAIGPRPGTWQSHITYNGRTRTLGVFECLGDAIAERCKAERHLFGAFARGADQ